MHRISQLLSLAILFALTIGSAPATTVSHFSGSYRVVQKADVGAQTHIRVQIRLVNQRQPDLHIQRITLWTSSHPTRDGSKPVSLVVRRGSSAKTTQDFTIPRSQYQSLSRGAPLKLLMAVESPGGHQAVELVRLAPASSGKAN